MNPPSSLSAPRDPSTSVGATTRAWTALGLVLACVGVAASLRQIRAPIDVYDEGLVLTHANHVLHGFVPYRDFYSNYPPGVFWLVAAAWKVVGESVIVERALGLLLHVAIASCAGRVAARAIDPARRFSWLAAGAVFVGLRHGPIWPTAWMLGLAFVWLAVVWALDARASRLRWFAAGVALGAAGCARHDLFVYICATAALAYAIAWARRFAARVPARPLDVAAEFPPRRVLVAFVLGASIPLALTWGWVLWKAGWRQPVLDLYSDQTRYVLPGRVLPLPEMWKPSFLSIAVWLEFLAPLVAGVVWARGGGSKALVASTVLAIGALPQMMGRTDEHHVTYVITSGLVIVSVALERGALDGRTRAATWATRGVALVLLCGPIQGLRFGAGRNWVPLATPRASGLPARDAERAAARDRVLAFVEQHSRADERIFVGNVRHDRVYVNDMDLYYLADRRGAVRRMQFDPNVTNREDEQLRMIREIDGHGTRVVVLAPVDYPLEPNDSSKSDSTVLDRWLAERFREVDRAGGYRMLLRAP